MRGGMRILGVGIVVMGVIVGAPAHADDSWTVVTESSTGIQHSVRTKDIINATDNPIVWVKGDASKNKTAPYRLSVSQYQIDCASQTSTTKARLVYGPDGAVLYSKTYPYARSSPIAPETVMAEIARNVCRTYDY
jgi:hypothetical protein